MEIVNTTPYRIHAFDCSPAPNRPALSILVKGTFQLRCGEPATVADAGAQQPVKGDEIHMDDLGRSLSYATDLVAFKTRGEVLMVGSCRTEGGRPRTEGDVGLTVGPIQKRLKVSGDRRWSRQAGGASISTAEPFTEMPLRYERAFGSLDSAANPLGLGVDAVADGPGPRVVRLPNVEYPDKRVGDPSDAPPPAGFGPISPQWQPRFGRQGTRDARWAAFRAPLPPEDFDPRFHNAAPDDQQLDEGVYFRGDEELVLEHVHPDFPEYRTALPGKRLRVFLLIRVAAGAPRFVEVETRLDTIFVDANAEKLVCVWRRPVQVSSAAHPEIEACYVAEEDLASEPLPAEAHHARLRELRPEKEDMDAAMQAEMDAQMLEANKVLKDGNLDPNEIAEVERAKSPADAYSVLMRLANEKIAKMEALTAKLNARPRGR